MPQRKPSQELMIDSAALMREQAEIKRQRPYKIVLTDTGDLNLSFLRLHPDTFVEAPYATGVIDIRFGVFGVLNAPLANTIHVPGAKCVNLIEAPQATVMNIGMTINLLKVHGENIRRINMDGSRLEAFNAQHLDEFSCANALHVSARPGLPVETNHWILYPFKENTGRKSSAAIAYNTLTDEFTLEKFRGNAAQLIDYYRYSAHAGKNDQSCLANCLKFTGMIRDWR